MNNVQNFLGEGTKWNASNKMLHIQDWKTSENDIGFLKFESEMSPFDLVWVWHTIQCMHSCLWSCVCMHSSFCLDSSFTKQAQARPSVMYLSSLKTQCPACCEDLVVCWLFGIAGQRQEPMARAPPIYKPWAHVSVTTTKSLIFSLSTPKSWMMSTTKKRSLSNILPENVDCVKCMSEWKFSSTNVSCEPDACHWENWAKWHQFCFHFVCCAGVFSTWLLIGAISANLESKSWSS